ncbi:hypothetical protein [Nonlabens antarcticus]|uniref:hypothetical protein n=1 Tax=Nonlabens antarcticus TaxID=392714 RepID=UPI001890B6AE|nr:hypothetical protein [Nonlabens antarcticus]
MKWILFLFWCCFVSAFAKAQSLQSPATAQTIINADTFYGVDDFNNLYHAKNNVFYKTTPADETTRQNQQFYDLQLGDLTSVDLINPLKILLFYRDTQTIVLLDNRLNESLRIVLSQIKPYRYFEFAALAGERRLWLYNMDMQRLELLDYSNEVLIFSSPAIQDNVHCMLTDYNYCHLITDEGIESYNNYGSKTATLKITDFSAADYDFEELVLLQGGLLNGYKFNKEYRFEKAEIKWRAYEEETPESMYLKNGKLYLYRRARGSVLEINQNKN